MRGQLDEYGSFVPYCEPAVRTQFLADITETVDWLYAAGETAPLADYETRLAKFREIGEAVRRRHRFYEALPETEAEYNKMAAGIQQKLNETTTLPEDSRQQILDKCKVAAEFWEKMKADVAKQQKWETPLVSNNEASEKFRLLQSEVTAIFNKPPPKPKEEKKDEAKKEEEKPAEPSATEDVPMDQEPPVSAEDLS